MKGFRIWGRHVCLDRFLHSWLQYVQLECKLVVHLLKLLTLSSLFIIQLITQCRNDFVTSSLLTTHRKHGGLVRRILGSLGFWQRCHEGIEQGLNPGEISYSKPVAKRAEGLGCLEIHSGLGWSIPEPQASLSASEDAILSTCGFNKCICNGRGRFKHRFGLS